MDIRYEYAGAHGKSLSAGPTKEGSKYTTILEARISDLIADTVRECDQGLQRSTHRMLKAKMTQNGEPA